MHRFQDHTEFMAARAALQVNLRFLAEKQMLALSLALLIAVWIGSKLR
jgi:hypothetical protein